MSSTSRGGVREEDDFYETMREDAIEAVERLRPYLPDAPVIFEPMAGRGALVKVLREVWPKAYIIANELNQARAEQLVFGAMDPKAGACGSLYDVSNDARLNHRIEVRSGILGEECGRVLTDFFAKLRKRRS